MDLEKINKTLREEDLKILNEILTDESLNEQDKNNMFYIAYYIIGESTGYYIHDERIIKLFNEFCQSNKYKQCFSEILTLMKLEIERVEYLAKKDNKPRKNTDDNSKKLSPYDLKKELIGRLYTTIEVALNIKNFAHDDFHEIIKILLNSKMDFGQNKVIPKLVKDENLRRQLDKLKIAIDVALNTDIQAHIGNGWDIIPFIINVITDKDILNFDNNTYRRVVELAMYNLQPYVLDHALKHDRLTLNKKLALIDYFGYMMKKHLLEYSMVSERTAEGHAENIIFRVAYCERLLSMDDETYKKTLQEIKNCNKPFSNAEIEANDKLTDTQREFVLSLIKNGTVTPFEPSDNQSKPIKDYKQDLACSAISPNAINLPIELYKKIMTLLDLLCQKTEDLYHKEKELKNYDRYLKQYFKSRAKQTSILALLNNEKLFNNNMGRLITAIERINSNNLTGKAREFCNHEMSMYYTDSEFQTALSLLRKAEDNHYSYQLFDLLTNKNIPFMENKNILFEKALSLINNQRMSNDTIIENFKHLTKKLNEEGTYNTNMYLIFNGVDEETIRSATNGQVINIKKLIKEQKANN